MSLMDAVGIDVVGSAQRGGHVKGLRPRSSSTRAALTGSGKSSGLMRRARVLDRLAADTLRPLALPALRAVLGLIFIWFGGLKVIGFSPVKAMVAGTLPWADPNVIVPLLGGVEVLLGLGLLAGVALSLVLPALVAHLAGTFLTFVMLPGQMFHGSDPLLLTQDGEFVMKNLVLIGVTLVLFTQTPRPDPVPIPLPRAPV